MQRVNSTVTTLILLVGWIASGISHAEELLVQPGDTLWSIAKSTRPDHLTIRQQAEVIFRTNTHAFADETMNSLRHGVRLTLPETTSTESEVSIQRRHQSAARVSDTSNFRDTITVIRGVSMHQEQVRR